jgi:hypothetical protein
MAVWSVCGRCGRPFSVGARHCPSCIREGYKAYARGSRIGGDYPVDMQFCTRHWEEVGKCGASLVDACARHGRYSCSAEEKGACSCRECCLRLYNEYKRLDERRKAEGRKKFFEPIDGGLDENQRARTQKEG